MDQISIEYKLNDELFRNSYIEEEIILKKIKQELALQIASEIINKNLLGVDFNKKEIKEDFLIINFKELEGKKLSIKD